MPPLPPACCASALHGRRRRVFLLGPSHHFYSKHCLLSPAEEYATPLGEEDCLRRWSAHAAGVAAVFTRAMKQLPTPLLRLAGSARVDAEVYAELRATGGGGLPGRSGLWVHSPPCSRACWELAFAYMPPPR